jgi:hypothetical protein
VYSNYLAMTVALFSGHSLTRGDYVTIVLDFYDLYAKLEYYGTIGHIVSFNPTATRGIMQPGHQAHLFIYI